MNTEKIFFKDNQHFKDTFVHCTRKQCINNQYCMSVRVRNLWDTTTIIELPVQIHAAQYCFY